MLNFRFFKIKNTLYTLRSKRNSKKYIFYLVQLLLEENYAINDVLRVLSREKIDQKTVGAISISEKKNERKPEKAVNF